MKINYISYFDPRSHRGGGEMISLDVINEGISRGHTFKFSCVRPNSQIEFDDTSDLDFLVDLYLNFPLSFVH